MADEKETDLYDASTWKIAECATCMVRFASPLLDRRLEDGLGFYCPVGHSNEYTEPARKRREKLELERMLLKTEPVYEPKAESTPAKKWRGFRGR